MYMLRTIRSKAARVSLALLGMTHAMSYAAEGAADPAVTDPHFELAPGYIPKENLPNSLDLLGPPPAADSAAFARDEEARKAIIPLRGGARAAQARLAKANAAVSTARAPLLPRVAAATTGWRWTSAMSWTSGARTGRA
ncbi:hypothetical protein G6F57_020523 [Rhizopus arrhizus]|nr:hypothetical protein G6F57_020523 [Rhizopus arrhizus]